MQGELISHNPDFNSILNVDGKIFSVTQYEWGMPAVAYLTELEQNKATGELTVCVRLQKSVPLSRVFV